MYTLQEVEKKLKISRSTLIRWIKNNTIKAVKIGEHWRISEEELNKIIEKGVKL